MPRRTMPAPLGTGLRTEGGTGAAAAWAWVDHLRAGGTEPWAHRLARAEERGGPARDAGDRDPWLLPGAQQLELLRRLNLAGHPPAVLVERVLAASAWGRGAPDLPLPGVGPTAEPAYGARPVDPGDLPDAELVRVAAGLLAEDLAARLPTLAPAADRPRARGRSLARPFGRSFVLTGDPWLTGAAATTYAAAGRHPIDPHDLRTRRAVVYVLGTDVLTMTAHAFTARSLDAGAPTWAEWLGPPGHRRRLAPRADVLRIARHWADRLGRERVRVVLGDDRGRDGWRELGDLVGVRRPVPAWPALSARAVELARVVGAPLGVLVSPPDRTRLLRGVLVPRLADDDGPPLGLPAQQATEQATGPTLDAAQEAAIGWADAWRARGSRERDALLAAGYPVTGDPDRLVPGDDVLGGGGTPDDAGVLALACRLLLAGPDRGRESS